ncbi:MAG: DEAD/DEAH box helicase [Planctomycetota bacterium]|jgi:DEAD/DEAH box helicase domain-containing protein
MEGEKFLERLPGQRFFNGQMSHVEVLSQREASFGEVSGGLHPAVAASLEAEGITSLYSHQAEAIEHVRAGENVVIVTGTASGKTLCYNIPIVETVIADSLATALFIYPTKALTQDQLRGIGKFNDEDAGVNFLAGTYDGDTPQNLRRRLRDGGNFVLTNPDMLHQGILPHHARWNRFFTHLKFVVLDEVHAYRGVFGSHLANVLRRLSRICNHYGAQPQFVCSSATIKNPAEHAERITGRSMTLVNNDGAPRGPKQFIMWNPPPLDTAARGQDDNWRAGGDRRSPLWEAVYLMSSLIREGIQTIAFTRTRLAAELIYKNTRDLLRPESRKLANSIRAYRGGYLPEERREIERQLVDREILGVASTNALELGIDIGSLDACIIVGYPGTVASLWQQAGRAGRGLEESVVFLIAQNSPIDQYLMTHGQYLFAQPVEQAVVDPDNPHIAIDHIRCACHELPMADEETATFGPFADVVLELLEEDQIVKHIDGRWYWSSSEYPAAKVNLRNIAGVIYTIQDEAAGERVIGTTDEISALSQLHTHAVYLHAGIAFVERRDLDYYTQSVQSSQIRIDEAQEQTKLNEADLGFGDVTATTTIPMFRKIRYHSRDSLGFEELELPPQSLETVAVWLAPPEGIVQKMQQEGMVVGEGLIGIANVLSEVVPMFVMCDVQDVGTVVNSSCLGRDAMFLYDRYPGGMGYARRCMDRMDEILRTIYTVVSECRCEGRLCRPSP